MRLPISKLLIISATLLMQSSAFAAGYGMAGCGLGSILIGKQAGFVQIFAATTNATSYSQTFGITSGTSNCVPASKEAAFNNQREFMRSNFASVAKEAAQGEGETLRAFALTLGCKDEEAASVAKTMQANHSQIFKNAGVDGVLAATHEALRENQNLVNTCSNII